MQLASAIGEGLLILDQKFGREPGRQRGAFPLRQQLPPGSQQRPGLGCDFGRTLDHPVEDRDGIAKLILSPLQLIQGGGRTPHRAPGLPPTQLLTRLSHPFSRAVQVVQQALELGRTHAGRGRPLLLGLRRQRLHLEAHAVGELIRLKEQRPLRGGGGAKLRPQRLFDVGPGIPGHAFEQDCGAAHRPPLSFDQRVEKPVDIPLALLRQDVRQQQRAVERDLEVVSRPILVRSQPDRLAKPVRRFVEGSQGRFGFALLLCFGA